MRRGLTLPLRGRVGAELRGGVMCVTFPSIDAAELVARVTPTRRFAATSPLKGEVDKPPPRPAEWIPPSVLPDISPSRGEIDARQPSCPSIGLLAAASATLDVGERNRLADLPP
jgi:hypothetical protein